MRIAWSLGILVLGCSLTLGGCGLGERERELKRRIDVLTTERDTLTNKLGELVARLNAQQQQDDEIRAQRAKLELHLAETQTALERSKLETQELRKGLDTERGRAFASEADLRAVENRTYALGDALTSLKMRHADLAGEDARLNDDLESARNRLAAAHGEIKTLRGARTPGEFERALIAENASLKQKLSEVEQQIRSRAHDRAGPWGPGQMPPAQLQARVVELSKTYQALLGKQKRNADEKRRAVIEWTRRALEEAQTEVAWRTGAKGIYAVRRGDSLSSIAQAFYHDRNRWHDILKANASVISRGDYIRAGMILVMPR